MYTYFSFNYQREFPGSFPPSGYHFKPGEDLSMPNVREALIARFEEVRECLERKVPIGCGYIHELATIELISQQVSPLKFPERFESVFCSHRENNPCCAHNGRRSLEPTVFEKEIAALNDYLETGWDRWNAETKRRIKCADNDARDSLRNSGGYGKGIVQKQIPLRDEIETVRQRLLAIVDYLL